jgi:hypothetical protein
MSGICLERAFSFEGNASTKWNATSKRGYDFASVAQCLRQRDITSTKRERKPAIWFSTTRCTTRDLDPPHFHVSANGEVAVAEGG